MSDLTVDIQKPTQGEQVDTASYREEMIKKYEEANNPNTYSPDRQQQQQEQESQEEKPLLAGKYKSEEELQKGIFELAKKKYNGNLEAFYKDLEKGKVSIKDLGGQETTPPPQDTKPSTEIKTESEARKLVSEKGLNFDEYAVEFANTGGLSDASLTKLEKAGIPRDTVSKYVEGLKAAARETQTFVYNLAGGEESFAALRAWGVANFSAEEKLAFDKAMTSGNKETMRFAVEALKSRFESVNGRKPKKQVEGQPASGGSPDVYLSWSEVTADMGNDKYKTSPSFRSQVQQKLRRSNL